MADDARSRTYEPVTGVTLALFAAVLAMTGIAGGKVGEQELVAHNERTGAYQWYQSKSMKQALVEGERDLLISLQKGGAIDLDRTHAVDSHISGLEASSAAYEKQKNEILLGSAAVGRDAWVQDIDGKLGLVKGAREWDARIAALEGTRASFDQASLFLQTGLVVGAISLVLQGPRARLAFVAGMMVLGATGTGFAVKAFLSAM